MSPGLRFLQLSPPRQVLVRLCQSINHGHIEALHIVDGEPTFSPTPTVWVDVKLDHDEGPRPEVELRDFELCSELLRLMSELTGSRTERWPSLKSAAESRAALFSSPQ